MNVGRWVAIATPLAVALRALWRQAAQAIIRRSEPIDEESGFVVIWLLCMAGFVLVGVFLVTDAWRIVAIDRDLSAAVDGAAAAGANGLDEQTYRDTGVVQLDPSRAEALAADNLGGQPHAEEMVNVSIDASPTGVTITAERPVDLLLLRFIGGPGRTVRAGATATPRRSV